MHKNAIIRSVSLSRPDHGCLSAWLHVDHDGGTQGFGGYNLYSPFLHKAMKQTAAGHFIWRCLEVIGVMDWDQLVGKAIRLRIEDGRIVAIGHIVKDNWFEPHSELERF